MIDISKQSIKIDCQQCKRLIPVTLRQVADEVLIKCSCGQEIQLKDSNGTNQKAIRDINKSFKKLEDTFRKFGR